MPRFEHLRRYGILSASTGKLSPEDSRFGDRTSVGAAKPLICANLSLQRGWQYQQIHSVN
jgi:hypothetical protein